MIKTNPLSDKSFPLEDKGESLEETDDLYREHAHEHSHSPHTHVHSEESLRRLVNRLSRIEGHIRGIKTMVQESQPVQMF
jgi:hypothetical protein